MFETVGACSAEPTLQGVLVCIETSKVKASPNVIGQMFVRV